jgi:phosphoribosylformylglycinamidine cyclo-ligase
MVHRLAESELRSNWRLILLARSALGESHKLIFSIVQPKKKEYLAFMKTYKSSGVDIEAGEELVRRIKPKVRSTFNKNVLADLGSFGAFYRASFKGIKKPVLVSSVDGVGTKLKIAFGMNRHDTVGQDLVNHCVNDILVCGAKPLYFMDYFATGRLSVDAADQVISGFVKACRENECALIGGETAEMPGFYPDGEYDLAGTIVGVVDEKKIINGKDMRHGDILIGLPSAGLHTNGYSLARAVLLERHPLDEHVDELGTTVGDALLSVHRSYFRSIYPLLSRFRVKGMSHITGGGIVGNTMRVVPKGLGLFIDWNAWERPAIFRLIQQIGNVPEDDMRRTFNLGVGLIMIVSPRNVDSVLRVLKQKKERPFVMGEVIRKVKEASAR